MEDVSKYGIVAVEGVSKSIFMGIMAVETQNFASLQQGGRCNFA